MDDFTEYLIPGFIGFSLIGGLIGIGLGIAGVVQGLKFRGWESGWSLIARDAFTLFSVAMIALAYSEDRLGSFWAFILVGLVQVPTAIYIVWNDIKFRKLTGDGSPLI